MKKVVLFVFIVVVFVSCGEDGKTGLTALTSFSEEEAGENCADGGMKVETGLDENRDGVLDEDEIQDTKYICNGEAGTNGAGTDGSDGTDGEDGADGADGVNGNDGASCWDLNENGECDLTEEDINGDDACTVADCQGTDGTDGEKGDPGDAGADGSNGVCAGNHAPVINEIKVNEETSTQTPVFIEINTEAEIVVDAEDVDGDPLSYSISGGFVDIVYKGNGVFSLYGDAEGKLYFSVIVSDGCQVVVKNFAVTITYPLIYSGENQNISYINFESPGIISLFDAEGTWDDMNLDLHAYSGVMNEFRFGNLLQNNGNYVEFAIGNNSSEAKRFLYGEEIDESFSYAGRSNYVEFSKYGTDESSVWCDVGEFKNETGYAGIKFTDGSDVYYGWIQISVTDYSNSNLTGTLIDWAYNPVANKPLKAGYKGLGQN